VTRTSGESTERLSENLAIMLMAYKFGKKLIRFALRKLLASKIKNKEACKKKKR
jgi:hypothetical protein